MSYLTKLRALHREEDITNKLNKCNYFNTLNNSATKETNLTKNVTPLDGPTEEYGEGGHEATKETKYTKKVPASPGSLDALSAISAKPQAVTPDTLTAPCPKVVLRCRASIVLTLDGDTIAFEPGNVFTVATDEAQRLLLLYPAQLEQLSLPASTAISRAVSPPAPPIQQGWLVSYRDDEWRVRGGSDEREAGTVQECRWDSGWMVILTNGGRVPLKAICAVSKTDVQGRILAAWTTPEHGYDGGGSLGAEERREAGDQSAAED